MFRKITFPNKARLIIAPRKDTKAVTVLFLFGVGSRDETAKIQGMSHFIEHMMYKGTKKRPTSLDLSRALDSVGAEFNAMTAKDYTGYYVKIDREDINLAIDVLSDMILNSTFAPPEIARERRVILEEINMYHDNPIMNVENVLEDSIFKGHPLGHDIAGTKKTVAKINRPELIKFKEGQYRPSNLVVCVAGNIDSGAEKLISRKLIDKIGGAEKNLKEEQFISRQNSPRVIASYKKTKQVHLALGFPSLGYNDERAYALHLLTIILGGNMSSRLFEAVRERRGLCYFIRCFPNFYRETGDFIIQGGLDLSRLDDALGTIFSELRRIKKDGVTAMELRRAKEFLRGKMSLNFEDSSQLAEFYAKQELLTGKILSLDQKMRNYAAVQRAEIQKLAREILRAERLNLALIGPYKSGKEFYKKIML